MLLDVLDAQDPVFSFLWPYWLPLDPLAVADSPDSYALSAIIPT